MGQVSEDMQDGICCQECGQWMPEVYSKKASDFFANPPGYPRTCPDCKKEGKNV